VPDHCAPPTPPERAGSRGHEIMASRDVRLALRVVAKSRWQPGANPRPAGVIGKSRSRKWPDARGENGARTARPRGFFHCVEFQLQLCPKRMIPGCWSQTKNAAGIASRRVPSMRVQSLPASKISSIFILNKRAVLNASGRSDRIFPSRWRSRSGARHRAVGGSGCDRLHRADAVSRQDRERHRRKNTIEPAGWRLRRHACLR